MSAARADAAEGIRIRRSHAVRGASIGVHLDPVEQQRHDATLDALREEISTEAIDVAFGEARSLNLEQIVALMRTG